MPTDIYTMDSLKITVDDDYEKVVTRLEDALQLRKSFLKFDTGPTLIVTDKITALVKVQTGIGRIGMKAKIPTTNESLN